MISWLKWLLGHVKAWFQVLMGVSDSETLQVHMDDPPITASLGPIDRLISQLQSLEGSKHNLPVELSANEIGILIKHLKKFCNPMKVLSEMDDTSFIDKWWMKEVRELCYDTEDYLEEVMMQYGAGSPGTWTRLLLEDVRIPVPLGRIAGVIIFWIHSKLKWRPQLSHFLARAEVLKGRCPSSVNKEKPDDISLNKEIKADISLSKENIADIKTLTAQLVEMLNFDVKQTELKVVPICGFEGAGKTILARTLFAKYKRRFQCWAFVRVPRNPDIRSILTSILSQIKAPPASPPMSQVQDLILSISTHLKTKRYFVVIDDIRRTSVWDIISRALPGENCGSRIIITTESEHVASACSGYYLGSTKKKMDALNACTYTITSEQKNKDINLRYKNLPLHLKTCLLFLGMHLEGCTITKDDLVKQWVAEGFIPALRSQETEEISEIPKNKTEEIAEVLQFKRDGISDILQDQAEEIAELPQDQTGEIAQVNQDQREEIARGYFDELVTRGMIQPVDINHNGEVLSCTVHHVVLDLIRYKSKEDNFIVVVDNLESTLGHPDIVRRLSVQFGCEKGASIPESVILSHVRSLTFYGFLECVPSIPDYGLLRVLILSIWADEDKIFDLTRIGELYHLRYLKIECNVTVRLPSKIRRLQHLGTLELHAEVVAIPSDVGHLEKLMHVCCPSKAVRDLGDLTSLLDLQLTCSTVENLEEHMKSLRSILERLSSLRCLALVPASGSCSVNTLPANLLRMCLSCDNLCTLYPAPANLQRLELSRHYCIFSGVPRWIGELRQLCILKIAVRELSMEDIDILRALSALTTLLLHVQPMSAERMVFGKEGFSLLTYFKLTCTVPWLEFEAGAMPNLEKLKLCFNSPIVDEQWTTRIIIIERLSRLKEISAIIDSAGVDEGTALLKAIRNDPRNPKVHLMGSIYYSDQGRGMVTSEGSGEDENNEANIRVHMRLEFSGLPIPEAHCREDEAEDRPFTSEKNSNSNESESTDGHNSQVVMHSGGSGGLSQGSAHRQQVPSKDDSINSDPEKTTKNISTGSPPCSLRLPRAFHQPGLSLLESRAAAAAPMEAPLTSHVTTAFSDSDSVSMEGVVGDSAAADADVEALRRLSDNLAAAFHSPDYFAFLADARVVVPGAPDLRVHRCVLSARSPFLRAVFARRAAAAAAGSSPGAEGVRLELRELLGEEVEVGYEALQLVLDYLYSGRVVRDLPKSACACVDEDGCAHVGCYPAVSFMVQVLFAASTFEVTELTNLFQRRLLDVLDKVDVDNLPLILFVANLCSKSCMKLLERCLEKVVWSNLDMITLEKTLPSDIIKQITDSRLSLGLVSPEDKGFPNKHVRRILRALDSDDVELVRMLLKEGRTNLDDAFALHYAVEHCDSKITTELLDIAHADVNLRNQRGYTVLHIAARRRDPKIVVSLLTKGARPSDLTIDGRKAVQISKRLTKHGNYFGITEEGKPSPKDRLCIEILEQAERRDPQLGEASVSLAMAGECQREKLLYLENRVALARIMFPIEARVAMDIAQVDGTLEFTLGSSANPPPEIQRATVDLNETPFRMNDEHLARMTALSKTVELGKRFFPRCSNVLDKIMDDEAELASLGRDTSTERKRRFQDLQVFLKKKRFRDLQDVLQKAIDEDKEEFDRSALSSSSSSTTSIGAGRLTVRPRR